VVEKPAAKAMPNAEPKPEPKPAPAAVDMEVEGLSLDDLNFDD
jgi:hypothetical protein